MQMLSSRGSMATITINLTPGAEDMLRQKASANGTTLESFVQELVQKEALATCRAPALLREEPLSLAEFDGVLDELVETFPPAPSLPVDFSRADIYAEHD
jgi:uncharacterized protein (DUF1778 family)